MSRRNDVTPPGREAQVQALKEKSNVENPWAVAWASYNKSDEGPSWMGARCDDCGMDVPVEDGRYVAHVSSAYGDAASASMMEMCDGGGAECRMDVVEHRGGKWVLIAKSTGKVLGEHETKEEALAQERAVQASKHADSARVRRFERLDLSAELPKPERTAEGFWSLAGRVAREGIQEYRDGAGGIRRELRLPEDVAASAPGFALRPLTNDHPPQMVNPKNAEQYVVGAVGEAKFDGGWVTAPLMIYDAEAIASVEKGRAQLSVGYTCRVEDKSGEWRGQKYDAVQKDIVVNHVALVDVARAGPSARLRLDAGDMACGFATEESEPLESTKTREQKPMGHTLRIDGLNFEVNDANAQAVVDRLIKKHEDQLAAEKQRADNADAIAAKARKDLDVVQARHDALEAAQRALLAEPLKIGSKEITVADARDASKRDAFVVGEIERAAAERASLLVEARKHLGANEVFDSHVGKDGKIAPAKSDLEIKRLVVEKLDKDAKCEGKSPDYVQARYDAVVERAAQARSRPVDIVREGATRPADAREREDGPPPSDPQEARRAMIARSIGQNVKFAKGK